MTVLPNRHERRKLKSLSKKENRMSRMNGGIVPGQVPLLGQQKQQGLGCQVNDGPLAMPIVTPPMNTPAGAIAFSWGGLTKVEAAAIQITASLLARMPSDSTPDAVAKVIIASVSAAEAVLDECQQRRLVAAQQPQPEPAK